MTSGTLRGPGPTQGRGTCSTKGIKGDGKRTSRIGSVCGDTLASCTASTVRRTALKVLGGRRTTSGERTNGNPSSAVRRVTAVPMD